MRVAKPMRRMPSSETLSGRHSSYNGGIDGSGEHQHADEHDKSFKSKSQVIGSDKFMDRPLIRLPKYWGRIASGMIMEAKKETPAVENEAVDKI